MLNKARLASRIKSILFAMEANGASQADYFSNELASAIIDEMQEAKVTVMVKSGQTCPVSAMHPLVISEGEIQ